MYVHGHPVIDPAYSHLSWGWDLLSVFIELHDMSAHFCSLPRSFWTVALLCSMLVAPQFDVMFSVVAGTFFENKHNIYIFLVTTDIH